MSIEDRQPAAVATESVNEVQMGDALAENADLVAALPTIHATIEAGAVGAGGLWAKRFLENAWDGLAAPAWTATCKAFEQAAKRFTHIETRRILARSEAKINQARANKIDAEADAIRAAEDRRDKLLEYLIQKDIDMASEHREDLLRIVFVKPERTETRDP